MLRNYLVKWLAVLDNACAKALLYVGKFNYGRWENGYLAQGKWTLPSGVFYVGSFKWNQPIGEGSLCIMNAIVRAQSTRKKSIE